MAVSLSDVASHRMNKLIDHFNYELETVNYFNKKISSDYLDEILVMEFAQSFIRYQILSASFAQVTIGVLKDTQNDKKIVPFSESSALRYSINNPEQADLVNFEYVSKLANLVNTIHSLKAEYLNRSNHAREILVRQFPDAYFQMYDISMQLIEENPMLLTLIIDDRLFQHGFYIMVDQTCLNITRKSSENKIAMAIRQQVFKLFQNQLFFIDTHPQVLHNLIIDLVNLYENERNFLTYQQLKGINEITPNVLFNYVVSKVKQNLIATSMILCTYYIPKNGERYPLADYSALDVVYGEINKNSITYNEFNDYSQSMIDQFYYLEKLSMQEIEKLEKDIHKQYPDVQIVIKVISHAVIDKHYHRMGLLTSKLTFFNTLTMIINSVMFKIHQSGELKASESYKVIYNELTNIHKNYLI
ncbi:hypothetical protein ACMGE6_11290 [Macrococcus equi]|uniref:hypothetical protein n=1 Tax=Macrococcus equi TaxID=3395462 RepID=UPI0039BE703A